MPAFTTITLVLICFDPNDDLDRTLRDLAAQVGGFRLQCHVVDVTHNSALHQRLSWWQEHITSGRQHTGCQELHFSHHSSPGAPLGQGLAEGFAECKQTEILSWAQSGDSLPSGALQACAEALRYFAPEHLSWLSCASPAPLPLPALRAGLCDGIHWPILPAAGTFFRPWLWQKAAPTEALQDREPARAAQALWQMFSQKASLAQISHLQAGAISDAPPPTPEPSAPLRAERRAALAALIKATAAGSSLSYKALSQDPQSGDMIIEEKDGCPELLRHGLRVMGETPELLQLGIDTPRPSRELVRASPPVDLPPLTEIISLRDNILAYDHGWQYPAITEQHAFHQIRDLGAVPDGLVYVAYPWATLIDKIHRKSADLPEQLERFRTFCTQLPKDTIKITCCQHIKMKEELGLFHQAGIHEIFWTHTTHDDIATGGQDGLRLHAFPLFPVQTSDDQALPGSLVQVNNAEARPHLFSFIGARANQHYLTGSRNWILDSLADDPRGQIIGRDNWHYNKVVYGHQIHNPQARKEASQAFIDTSASEQFRTSLLASVFSLCPSGTGPNSIRLWESLGLGAIPVILADSWAPPGDLGLWQAGAIFCKETPEAIAALPDRLAALAADTETLAGLRLGAAQLWTLYGPHSFIYDLQKFLIEATDYSADSARPQLPLRLAQELVTVSVPEGPARSPSPQTARLYLNSLISHLLLEGPAALLAHQADPLARAAEDCARDQLPATDPLLTQLKATQTLLHRRAHRAEASALAAPATGHQAPLRVCLMGQHSNRTPLAYAPFQQCAGERIALTQQPEHADLVLSGFNRDLRDIGADLLAAQRSNPGLQVVIMSEEPLWDSIWSGDLMSQQRQMALTEGRLDYHVFNHSNCGIFDFETIPYFLLTRSAFQTRYGLLLARHVQLSPQALLQHWQSAPVPAAFYAEARDNPAYSKTWPAQEVFGLSLYRSDVARGVNLPGTQRQGQGWRPGAKRQALPDWHLDKLAALDMRCRVVSAYENTHQNTYISEKIFDAFVIAGIPTYYAGPKHRIHDLIPEAAMLNTYGLSATEAAAKIVNLTPDLAMAEAWLASASALQARFSDLAAIAQERHRITDAVITTLRDCRP